MPQIGILSLTALKRGHQPILGGAQQIPQTGKVGKDPRLPSGSLGLKNKGKTNGKGGWINVGRLGRARPGRLAKAGGQLDPIVNGTWIVTWQPDVGNRGPSCRTGEQAS